MKQEKSVFFQQALNEDHKRVLKKNRSSYGEWKLFNCNFCVAVHVKLLLSVCYQTLAALRNKGDNERFLKLWLAGKEQPRKQVLLVLLLLLLQAQLFYTS